MSRLAAIALVVLGLAVASPARAHHGVAAIGVAGPEGPGAAMETTSPLPLPAGTLFSMAKTEYVPFQRFEPSVAEKTSSSFNMVALGYGVRPWLSAYVFQSVNAKAQQGLGTNVGAGDTNLMLSAAFKWDEGLQLAPERESLDDLLDWHFGAWFSSTLPVGPTAAKDRTGGWFAPDMQTGFGAPSPVLGVAVMKQLGADLTWLADASYQHFFPNTYRFTRYRFGGETRLDTAAVWRAYGAGSFRLDVCGELNALHLQRDQQRDGAGAMVPLRASGGAILYAGAGVRAYHGPFTLGVGVRRAALTSLNERAAQQGSEGLERFRAALTFSYATRL